MTSYRIYNEESGVEMGVYEGATEAEALDAMAKDAGYDSFDAIPDEINGDGLRVEAMGGGEVR
jgi:hypothetical protein